ncbi:uncharacterized protein LOC133848714 [Drosophila sulfurigaster albostrigata]|uniref:uncharacterized protein LOC133848714 n=1 Tax=Drosophila sulfurigaster albostrigata TaxID=89887 RepID=UPI002D21B509|nr:uncharacterized protein LOC133848714 [Drosophila sulfurigaster albostrigata]
MPFPIHPPKQMPCPHWQHFPISPVDSKPSPFGSNNGNGNSNNNGVAAVENKPPEPQSYRYCVHCKAAAKDVSDMSKD